MKNLKSAIFVSVLTFLLSTPALAEPRPPHQTLPSLGDAAFGLSSLEQEYKLGRHWLMSFRSQVNILDDPMLQDYLEHIVYHLATFSQLEDRRLDMVIVNNPTINAFAVPGGVIGINTGLFIHAETEAQLATVLSHELAHLSQRHFARSVEEQRRNYIPRMAGLLAGILLAAKEGGDAGIAAITASQAASRQGQLRYSRGNEQEADRIGMQTMVAAGIDPYAASDMFNNMLKVSRFAGKRPPEFLLTHPIIESRIADTKSRARQYPRKVYTGNRHYQLMRARAELGFIDNSRDAVKIFRTKVRKSSRTPEADQYGLVLALTKEGQLAEAEMLLTPLIEAYPNQIPYLLAASDLEVANGDLNKAIKRIQAALDLSIGNHPLTMALAKNLLKIGQAHKAAVLLEEHSKRRPTSPDVWYQLAEAYGLAGDIVGVHQARAEYFVLNGNLGKATKQLSYALPLVDNEHLKVIRINERIKQINTLQQGLKKL